MFQATKVGITDGTIQSSDAFFGYVQGHTTTNLAKNFGVAGQQVGAPIAQQWSPQAAMNACDIGIAIWSGQTAPPTAVPMPIPLQQNR